MASILGYLFGKSKAAIEGINISFRVYSLLWALGLLGTIFSYFELQKRKVLGLGLGQIVFGFTLGDVCVGILALSTLLFQWEIYKDFHKIEDKPESADQEYRNWIDVRLERWIRYWIMMFLLVGVGKFAEGFSIGGIGPKDPEMNLPHIFVIIGSVVVFGLLAVWNVFALVLRIRNKPPTTPGDIAAFVHEWVVTFRIAIFMLLSGVCCWYWLFVLRNSPWVSGWAQLFIVLYLGLVTCVEILIRKPAGVENLVAKFLEGIRPIYDKTF
jgi:hypothetical protein